MSATKWALRILIVPAIIISLCLGTISSIAAATEQSPTQRHTYSQDTCEPPYTIISPQTVTFDAPTIVSDPVEGEYDWPTFDDCQYISNPGHPALPYKVVVFKANIGYEISGVTVDISSVDLEGNYNIMPAPNAALLGVEESLSDSTPAIYSSDEPYPGDWYRYNVKIGIDPETMTRIKYVIVHLYPLQYEPVSGKIVRAEEATISVNYSGSPIAPAEPTTDLLIITSPALEPQANELADYRNSIGISTMVKTTDWIYAWYPYYFPPEASPDEQKKIRTYIESIDGLKYVLIFGDEDQVPVRYAYIPDGYNDGDLVPTDLYYADLDGTWNADNDNYWGEPVDDAIDGIPDLYIGRLPASNASETQVLVSKIKAYEHNTSPGDPWFKKALLIGTDTHGGREGERLKDYIEANYIPANWTVTKLYETYGNLSVTDSIVNQINNGYGLVNYAGHGSYDGWYWDCDPFLGCSWCFDTGEVSELTNSAKLPVVFTMSCSTSEFDYEDLWGTDYKCLGEKFMLESDGGAIAYFGATRVAWTNGGDVTSGLAGELDWRFSEQFFDGERLAGKIWGKAMTDYVIAYPPSTLSQQKDYGWHYYDWKTAAEYGSPFMDPTLMIGGREQVAITINTSGLVSAHPATIHYVEGGIAKTATTYSTWSGTPDYGSISSIENPVEVPAIEQYYTSDTTSWTVTEPKAYSVTYHHQFKPTISVTTIGTSLTSTNHATLSYYYNGSPATWQLYDGHSFNIWVDAGSTATLSNISSGSTSTHRWYCPGTTSWVIDDAGVRTATYWEQFSVIIATKGLNSAHPATIIVMQHGAINNPTTYATWSDWTDAGSALSISNRMEGGWIGDWSTDDTTSWTVDSTISAAVGYHRSYVGLYALVGGLAGAAVAIGTFIIIRRKRRAHSS